MGPGDVVDVGGEEGTVVLVNGDGTVQVAFGSDATFDVMESGVTLVETAGARAARLAAEGEASLARETRQRQERARG